MKDGFYIHLAINFLYFIKDHHSKGPGARVMTQNRIFSDHFNLIYIFEGQFSTNKELLKLCKAPRNSKNPVSTDTEEMNFAM